MYFLNWFVFNLLEVDFYKCYRGHQGYSIILSFISMLLYCIYMHDTRKKWKHLLFVHFTMLMPQGTRWWMIVGLHFGLCSLEKKVDVLLELLKNVILGWWTSKTWMSPNKVMLHANGWNQWCMMKNLCTSSWKFKWLRFTFLNCFVSKFVSTIQFLMFFL